ncbi:A-kinase anchor protein SPHKAP isoform X2 [Hippocampus zosterae]|uniref:A-kinase anchor protein SPHKAP isoform X2 n=1 Tax=Hippocampus zosterae TaxID=109293 RepID=UPI00223CE40C|nr:A-kinase anchor protein SPHKAP isoform X2 [Hippocampus zosterae]
MTDAKCLLKTPCNFQSSAMFEDSESVEVDGSSTESTVASTISACKKVLCSNGVLDSSDYWLRNNKVLCRLGLLDDNTESSCTTMCFVKLDPQKTDCRDDESIKKLALVSPDLPKLVELLTAQRPKENEILFFNGLEGSDTCQTHPTAPSQQQRRMGVCLLQRSGQKRFIQPSSIIFEINRFLAGFQWGQEGQLHQGQIRQRVDDDTNRSVSSIEEDFLTASEHMGDDSEDDGFRNEAEVGEQTESLVEVAQKHNAGVTGQRGQLAHHQRREGADLKTEAHQRVSRHTKESAGYYATNLAESVLQDAFIRLSQDETSFISEAAVSVSHSQCHPNTALSPRKQPSQLQTCSFELPKIVIVQSPDSADGTAEWPETQVTNVSVQDITNKDIEMPEKKAQIPHHNGGPPSKPVEVALACAANVIGTITSPQLARHLTQDCTSEEDTEAELEKPEEKSDYSFSSAICSMAQVAGAVAALELTDASGEGDNNDRDLSAVYTTSQGLISAAQTSAAFTLHCSVAEGTSVDAFRANIAEVFHREAAGVLTDPHGYRSVADLLESTHNKIVDGITCPKKSYTEESEVSELINEMADSLFKHALEKAKRKKELEGTGKDAPHLQALLQDSVNNLLFEILCQAQKKISHISRCDNGTFETQDLGTCSKQCVPPKGNDSLSQLQGLAGFRQSTNTDKHSGMRQSTDNLTMVPGISTNAFEESDVNTSLFTTSSKEQPQHACCAQSQLKSALHTKDWSGHHDTTAVRVPVSDIPVHGTERRGRFATANDSRQSSLTPQSSLNSCSSLLSWRMDSESRTPITCYADDLAATVVSMATELAAIYLENSTGKQPWFCALKGTSAEGPEAFFIPACRTVFRRKESQSNNVSSKKHRAPRLSEIKKKTEEQPELMERLVNRVVDESVNLDESQDPFALFASEVTARIMNCPELNVVDTSKTSQPRSRLQCERWSRGKASSYESIPEEDADPSGTPNTLGPGSRLGQNLSRGSSISKQSSCESITDEFSRFMVNQMETEGRGFDLLLDYYAGKNASSILAAAVQQAASKKNGHLNVRTTSCLSKQSSTESITEEFYRFMLRDMDKENKEHGIAKTKEWSNSLFPPSPRSPFCIRQSSVPDRRSSDSRLTVNSPIKANSFDGFAQNVHGDTLTIYPRNSVAATGLCKSDSCLYQRGKTDQITDMLIHDTWSSSIESLMRKNKIIADPEDSIDLEGAADPQPHIEQFANRLAADIVDIGKSSAGDQREVPGSTNGPQSQMHIPVGERRRGFKQSHLNCSWGRSGQEQTGFIPGPGDSSTPSLRAPRDVPVIHIEGDTQERRDGHPERPPEVPGTKCTERIKANGKSSERDRSGVVVAKVVKRDKRSMSASSEESMGSWSHINTEDEPPEETSSFIQLSEGNATSSDSSVGMADLEIFSDVQSQSTEISAGSEKGDRSATKDCYFESSSARKAGGGGCHVRELLVINCDLEADCLDSEVTLALEWIAASELGLQELYFKKSKEKRVAKFQKVVHLMSQKSWKIADLFDAVVRFCKLHEESEDMSLSSLFDWLLEIP